jgi:dolichol-phosphate mannosyltransferase
VLRTLIVIPTYNEIENLRSLVTEVLSKVHEKTHLLIVDDNSPDGTGDLADQLSRENDRVHVLHRARKLGLGTAYVAGFKYGLQRDFEVLVEMDCDFSHDPKYLAAFFSEIEAGADVVVGSRYVPGGGTVNWGLGRRIISKGGSLYARTVLGVRLSDLTGGFNCWRRSVIEAIGMDDIKSDGYSFQIEMKFKAWQKGYKIVEVPIVFEDRYLGKSKMSKHIVVEAMGRVLLMRLQSLWPGQLLPGRKGSH